MAQTRDLIFLARQWETIELPKEKRYLLRYFDTPLQEAVLKYLYIFDSFDNFVDHTGLACSHKWLVILYNRLKRIESLRQETRANKDMKTLALIESGKYKL